MKSKKTLSTWLTTRHQFVIRSEENFAEKQSIGFSYAQLILLAVVTAILLFALSMLMAKTVLARWYDPKHEQMVLNQRLIELGRYIDSLETEEEYKDQYINNLRRVISGDTVVQGSLNLETGGQVTAVQSPENLQSTGRDSLFRKEFEESGIGVIGLNTKYKELEGMYYFAPLTGSISDHFNLQKGHFGVDIVAKANEPIKAITDGTVIFSSWTQDSGYVIILQHRGNLISAYKHNAQLLKKVGTFVTGGEIIAIIGNTGELTNGPHLHFELWYNGNVLNPEEFINF